MLSKKDEEYIGEVNKQFYQKYTTQFEESAGEIVDDKFVIWYYHTIMGDNIGVYLDNEGKLQVYEYRY